MYNSSSVFAVNYQARSLCAQKAVKDHHRFLVGTCSLHDSNELSVLLYSEDSNHFEATAVYSHPDQIWAVESSPSDPTLVLTSRQSPACSKAVTLWRMPNQTEEHIANDSSLYANEHLELQEIASFNQSQKVSFVDSIKWHRSESKVLTFDGRMLSTWALAEDKITSAGVTVINRDSLLESDNTPRVVSSNGAATWDPHCPHVCAVGCGSSLSVVDTREMEVTQEVKNAHKGNIRDVDYNPNRSLTVVTGGDDRTVKFWDLRNTSKPIMHLQGHHHWVTSVKYNPYHDQLLLSGGSDHMVNLWRVASVSSSPWLSSEMESDGENDPPDVRVRCIDQHEDSIYSVAWSAAEAWVYCSLSYDGRVIVNHVPSTEKYKILL